MFWIYDHSLNYVRVKFLETIQTSILVLFYVLHFDLMARFWIFLWWIMKAFSISSNSSKEEFVYLYTKRVSCSLTIRIFKDRLWNIQTRRKYPNFDEKNALMTNLNVFVEITRNLQWCHWMFWIYDHSLNYVRVKFLETIDTSILVLSYALHFDLFLQNLKHA